jgi:hypothetical protein
VLALRHVRLVLDDRIGGCLDDGSAEGGWPREVSYFDDDLAVVAGDVDGLGWSPIQSVGDFADGSLAWASRALVTSLSAISVSFFDCKHEGVAKQLLAHGSAGAIAGLSWPKRHC